MGEQKGPDHFTLFIVNKTPGYYYVDIEPVGEQLRIDPNTRMTLTTMTTDQGTITLVIEDSRTTIHAGADSDYKMPPDTSKVS